MILQTCFLPPDNLGRLLNRGSNQSLLIKWGLRLFLSGGLSMSCMCRLDIGCSCLDKDYEVVKTRPGPSLWFKRASSPQKSQCLLKANILRITLHVLHVQLEGCAKPFFGQWNDVTAAAVSTALGTCTSVTVLPTCCRSHNWSGRKGSFDETLVSFGPDKTMGCISTAWRAGWLGRLYLTISILLPLASLYCRYPCTILCFNFRWGKESWQHGATTLDHSIQPIWCVRSTPASSPLCLEPSFRHKTKINHWRQGSSSNCW